MSLYIIHENQKLIWDYIHKIPFYVSAWQNSNLGQKETQFNQIIQHFYETVQYKTLNVQDVQQLNRQTIMAILDDTKKMTYLPPRIDNTVTQQYMLEHKQQEITSQYNDREKEYTLMLNGNTPPQIDFRIAEMDEGPIEDMNALIEQHMKTREIQFQESTSLNTSLITPLNTPLNTSLNTPLPEYIDTDAKRDIANLTTIVQEMKRMIEKMQEEIQLLKTPST